MKLKFMVAVMAAFAFVFSDCDSKDAGNKQLVLYYSQTGSTKMVAEEIQKMLDAEIELIEFENTYTSRSVLMTTSLIAGIRTFFFCSVVIS